MTPAEKAKIVFDEDGCSVQRAHGGGHELYFRGSDGTLARVMLPDEVPAAALLAIGADKKPTPAPKKAPRKRKVVVESALDEG